MTHVRLYAGALVDRARAMRREVCLREASAPRDDPAATVRAAMVRARGRLLTRKRHVFARKSVFQTARFFHVGSQFAHTSCQRGCHSAMEMEIFSSKGHQKVNR